MHNRLVLIVIGRVVMPCLLELAVGFASLITFPSPSQVFMLNFVTVLSYYCLNCMIQLSVADQMLTFFLVWAQQVVYSLRHGMCWYFVQKGSVNFVSAAPKYQISHLPWPGAPFRTCFYYTLCTYHSDRTDRIC